MNAVTRSARTTLVGTLLLGVALPFAAVLSGCTAECVDRFDCARKAKPKELDVCPPGLPTCRHPNTPPEVFTCIENKCVAAAPLRDAGEVDAGQPPEPEVDAGVADAGVTDGGNVLPDAGPDDAGMGSTDAGGMMFVATLSASQEVQATPVASTASGSGVFELDNTSQGDGGTVLHYALSYTGITTTVNGAHLHLAPGGVNGPVVIPLTVTASPITGSAVLSNERVAQLKRGLLYANIHSVANAGGEIRGQLLRPGEVLYTSVLNGTNVFPANLSSATGGAQIIYSADAGQVRYDGLFAGFDPTQAVLHQGGPQEQAGTILLPLNVVPVLPEFTDAGPGLSGTFNNVANPFGTSALGDGGFYLDAFGADGGSTNPLIRGQITAKP